MGLDKFRSNLPVLGTALEPGTPLWQIVPTRGEDGRIAEKSPEYEAKPSGPGRFGGLSTCGASSCPVRTNAD